ncbi:MAG: hypothetical protein R8N50_03370 [Alphaproteobacteria bacterium]|nr:hypothetical protein [Alphaproteobacteria bacterium]
MKRVLVFLANLVVCVGVASAAVRDGTAVSRVKSDKGNATGQVRTATVVQRNAPRTTVLTARTGDVAVAGRNSGRTITGRSTAAGDKAQTAPGRSVVNVNAGRNMTPVVARTGVDMSNTRTGAEYEQCKNTYFSCMDQFCSQKNDDYRRCSCNNRVFELDELRGVLEQAGEKLNVFNESLDVVGMTAAQATAMRTQSEGEAALTEDNSASKALLQAIMNSIRKEDSTVGGKFSDLNSINISFDTVNAFGMVDAGQAIASYNGTALYSAVYPQCRNAVRADCNDASLQRAITAYLMAIEQDCNTVQTAIEQTQNKMKGAVREGSAMLDLARIENRQKHNSWDMTTCINEVENAILSEQVCGANYHKCLDDGQFVDVSTGKPIAGVEDFYRLEQLLVFSDGVAAADQKLSKNPSNRVFVQNFENRVKNFAADALDKCVENADAVWAEYLDKAMLAIYYAQKAKVAEIKQGCFDFVASCYMNGDSAITTAMAGLTGEAAVVLQPDKVALSSQMCSDYVNSCDNMFDGNIVAQYVDTIKNEDTLTACRAVVKQCFDKYGGTNYENFYYPYSGLFPANSERAPDWFALYEIKYNENDELVRDYKSECAKQLRDIAACSDPELIEQVFGGFDVVEACRSYDLLPSNSYKYGYFLSPLDDDESGSAGNTVASGDSLSSDYNCSGQKYVRYGLLGEGSVEDGYALEHRAIRSTGVATEVYNQILSALSIQCMNLQGRFMEYQFFEDGTYDEDNLCLANFGGSRYDMDPNGSLVDLYHIANGENMCPRDYNLNVAIQSWGACSCWENGARRSKWGKSVKCVAALPANANTNDAFCHANNTGNVVIGSGSDNENNWCTARYISGTNQVCAMGMDKEHDCEYNGYVFGDLPRGIN